MKPRLIVAILVIASLSLCAEAQELSAGKPRRMRKSSSK